MCVFQRINLMLSKMRSGCQLPKVMLQCTDVSIARTCRYIFTIRHKHSTRQILALHPQSQGMLACHCLSTHSQYIQLHVCLASAQCKIHGGLSSSVLGNSSILLPIHISKLLLVHTVTCLLGISTVQRQTTIYIYIYISLGIRVLSIAVSGIRVLDICIFRYSYF